MNRIAIFASGNGSNAQRIIEHFRDQRDIRVALIISNKADAYVLERAKNEGVPSAVFSRQEFAQGEAILELLRREQIDFIVLAGFLLLLPPALIAAFPKRIINIHPALLPAYGGKGMYGDRVHEAVLASGVAESGITIHYVNENYDEGDIILQASCPVMPGDTVESLATRIHHMEHELFPRTIEKLLRTNGR
jgi:phosphoribosylglycinamide formyltransferase-1